MSAALFYRLVFAGLLAATVASNIRLSPQVAFDVRARVIGVMTKAGATVREDGLKDGTALASILFDLPGCTGPVQVMPVSLNLHESPIFAKAVRPDYLRRFMYLDRQWVNEDRLGLRLAWLEGKALSVFGLGRFDTETTALLVAEPEGCGAFERVDWPAVWERGGGPVPAGPQS